MKIIEKKIQETIEEYSIRLLEGKKFNIIRIAYPDDSILLFENGKIIGTTPKFLFETNTSKVVLKLPSNYAITRENISTTTFKTEDFWYVISCKNFIIRINLI